MSNFYIEKRETLKGKLKVLCTHNNKMANSEEFVISVNKNNSGYYRLHTIWKPNELAINVASDTGAWSGSVSKESLSKWGQMANTTPELYLADCKLALTTQNGQDDITYTVENNCFNWKRVCGEDGVRIKLGSIPLEPARFPHVIQNMMDVALKTNQKLESQINNLQLEKGAAESNIDDLLNKLEAAAKLKSDMETDMMAQFLAILNTKKNKISELEEELIKTRASVRPHQKPKKKQKGEKEKNNPYTEDTDEEMPLEMEPGPSRVKSKAPAVRPTFTSSDSDEKTTPPRSPERLPGQGKSVNDKASSSLHDNRTDARIFDMDVPIDPEVTVGNAPLSPDLAMVSKDVAPRVGTVDSGLDELDPVSSSPDLLGRRRLGSPLELDDNTPDNIVTSTQSNIVRSPSPVTSFPDRSQDVLSFFFGPD